MAGLDPAIHVFVLTQRKQDVDHRDTPGEDGLMCSQATELANPC
jgi:hypothetical protein